MTLVATAGASNANTYASLDEADAYNAGALNADSWGTYTDTEKEAALKMAARLLDAMPQAWTGAATSSTQAMKWPRKGMLNQNDFSIADDIIPQQLKDAQSEFARLLREINRLEDNDVLNQGIKLVSAGPVTVEYHRKDMAYGIVPESISADQATTAMVPDIVRAMLVASWLRATVGQIQGSTGSFLFVKNLG